MSRCCTSAESHEQCCRGWEEAHPSWSGGERWQATRSNRCVEYGEFERLGSETLRQTHVRVRSATHHPLPMLTKTKGFRQDLLFRINGITVVVPPLRARPNDLRALVASEIARASQAQGKAIIGLHRTAAERILKYAWPGNLRELSNVIQAAVALTTGPAIPEEVLMLQADVDTSPAVATGDGDGAAARSGSLRLTDAVHAHIRFVMDHVRGNKRRAARELGVGRETLARKLREMDR